MASAAAAAPTSEARRASACSDTSSILSGSTVYSITKEKDAQPKLGKEEKKKSRRGLRQKARDMVSDMGKPPTSRQDEKDGKRTLNYQPLGGMIGEPMARPGVI